MLVSLSLFLNSLNGVGVEFGHGSSFFLSLTLRRSSGVVGQGYSDHAATAIKIRTSVTTQMQCAIYHCSQATREAVTY